jgi:hypothetical protein
MYIFVQVDVIIARNSGSVHWMHALVVWCGFVLKLVASIAYSNKNSHSYGNDLLTEIALNRRAGLYELPRRTGAGKSFHSYCTGHSFPPC